MKILIADDSMTMRRIIINALVDHGASSDNVLEAEDGERALALWQAEGDKVGLALLDWNMPNMNGLDTLHLIRDVDKKTPIIMVTTHSEKTDVVSAISEGATNYIIKPFEVDTLIAKVSQFIDITELA
ncbi:response regulator [Piscirickettsia salmonis]|uniref:response regulator n=1 Tax=Piscirickettsia salmonis TaxID=1238 RepID=UPI0007C92191|nr:Chemotaxis protein CheY [Piscirickettsiaceae bacterium NZ-RLO1]